MAGIAPTASDIQNTAGQTALTLKKAFAAAVSLNDYLVAHSDADLVALGLSQADVTLLKAAYADLAYMKSTAFDSSQNVKQLWGLGV